MNLRSISLVMVFLGLAGLSRAGEPMRLAGSPALSPDGSTLAFEWNGDLWTVPVTGGAARQLTTDLARDRQPSFSPSGKEIAFVSDRDGAPQVYVMPATGGAPRQLTFHSSGCTLQEWTPDGTQLLVSASRDHHWRHADRFFLISAKERGPERMLFDDYGRDGTLSPDGKRLLFTREGEQWWRKDFHGSPASQIWLYELDGKKFTKLLAGPRSFRSPLWRPDGKAFFYVGSEKGYTVLAEHDLDTGKSKELYRAVDDLIVMPRLSRNGNTLVFRRLFDLYSMQPGARDEPRKIDIVHEGDRRVARTDRRTLTSATQAAFTNDGLEIAFVAGGDVWVMDTELREPRQVTATAEDERSVTFSPTGDAVYFVSEREGKSDVWKAERADGDKYWWQNRRFKLTQITKEGDVTGPLKFTPDRGRARRGGPSPRPQLAYQRGRGDLWLADLDGNNPKRVLESWSMPDYDFSPDGRWLVYAQNDDDFNREVWLTDLDGSAKPFNLSRHHHNEFDPVWSPDGRMLAYRGARASRDGEAVISLVYLRAEDAEKTGRDRTLEKALEKMIKGRTPATKPPEKPQVSQVVIDFEGLRERIRRVSLGQTGSANALFWSPDGKKLAFTGSYEGKPGTYTVEVDESTRTPKSLASGVGQAPRWLRTGNQIVWLANGVPASLPGTGAPSGSATTPTTPAVPSRLPPSFQARLGGGDGAAVGTLHRFSVIQEIDLGKRYAAAFDLCWRTMRHHWYDDRLGNRDWDAVRKKYVGMAGEAPDIETLTTVISLMLGELNGSHLGFMASGTRSRGSEAPTPAQGTAHLGVRFDLAHQGPGLKVRDVLPGGPADQKRSRILPGEVVLAIDGEKADSKSDLTRLLNGPLSRDIELTVQDKDGKDRTVLLRPISYTAARSLLYEKWLLDNRAAVDRLSDGKLGYLHISAMNMSTFQKFEEELCSVGSGKDGLVIDVRENGGGSTADHLLTALTQPVHAIAVPRGGGPGYPQDRKVYVTWNKPIVVLCNQNSFSNAEIFSHAIKTLKRGQLVGVPTGGGVISTGAASIMDLGMLRLPTRGWYLLDDGRDMELNGAVPHHVVWPHPGDMAQGKDAQLAKGVDVLLADVQAWKQRPRPKLEKATERKDDASSRRD